MLAYQPVGLCVLITPWNCPMNQIAAKVGPALVEGCTMVLKPSEMAPPSAKLFAEFVDEAEFRAGVFNMIYGTGAAIGDALTSHRRVDMVSFTGSTCAGIQIAKSAAETVKRVSQELGGKSPNIVLGDDGVEAAVKRGVRLLWEQRPVRETHRREYWSKRRCLTRRWRSRGGRFPAAQGESGYEGYERAAVPRTVMRPYLALAGCAASSLRFPTPCRSLSRRMT